MGSANKRKPVRMAEGLINVLPYQQAWISDPSPIKLWVASRQIGKSYALALEAIYEALRARCNCLILSTSERQSREVMQKVLSHLRVMGALTDEMLSGKQSMEEISMANGSRILSLPANPGTVRGFSGHVYLDEFAFHGDAREIWRAMYPTITRGYKVRVASTPNGRHGLYYELAHDTERYGVSRHRTTIHEAIAQGLVADIAVLRRGCPDQDMWDQEYECAFIDGNSALLTYELIEACETRELSSEISPDWSPEGDVYLGMDIGRKRDLTVAWLIERVGDVYWTRGIVEMRNVSFRAQAGALDEMIHRYKPRRVCIDATGIGMQLAEEARARHGYIVEPVTFTAASKEEMALTLRRRFEDRRVRIPSAPDIREDLHSITKLTTAAGNVRYDAGREGDSHADRFWALALAVHAGAQSGAAPVAVYSPARQGEYVARRPGWGDKRPVGAVRMIHA